MRNYQACRAVVADIFITILLGLVFNPDDGGEMLLRNVPLFFSRLHSVTSQKMEVFKTELIFNFSSV